uniref:Nucleotidyltransferase domain-containing protein n=1 Tax=Candidatus Kentrum sp. FW TaxID=2126338 RepID=A0A450SK76_9GAMM|nr:MAG: Nucleotidyltransferase domain-containing protein [Candidatus Kentron sp. FW]
MARLSPRLAHEISKSIEESFGPVAVILFGSRTDDARRGGDIDIAIESDLSREEFRTGKARVKANLIRKGLDLQLDLVQLSHASPLLRKEIIGSGIPLCDFPEKA